MILNGKNKHDNIKYEGYPTSIMGIKKTVIRE